jgi:predicted N-acetyltransferase YhbS
MAIAIAHLFERPALRPAAAQLIYDEFWVGKAGFSPAHFEGRLREAVDPGRLPLSLVACDGDRFLGTINLIDNDDDRRTHLWPWLAALAVAPASRGRGIGTRLVERLLAESARLGIDRVYFGTDGPGFYRRLGAVVHETVRGDFCIMRLDALRAQASGARRPRG